MDRFGQFFSAGKRIATEPWCVLSLLFLSYMGLAALDKYLLEGEPVKGSVLWLWETILAFPQKPLVQLLLIPLALWMFGHGIKQIIAQQASLSAKELEENENRALREREIWLSAQKLPVALARCYATRLDLDRLDAYIKAIQSEFDRESCELNVLEDNEETIKNFARGFPFENPGRYSDEFEIQKLAQIGISAWDPTWKLGAITAGYLPGRDSRRFTRDHEQQYITAAKHNRRLIEIRLKQLENVRDRARTELQAQERAIWEAAAKAPDLTAF